MTLAYRHFTLAKATKKYPRQSVKLIFYSRAGIFQEESKDSFSYLECNRSASITRHLKRLRGVR